MKYNSQKFHHYFKIVLDVVYCAGFIWIFCFCMYTAIANL